MTATATPARTIVAASPVLRRLAVITLVDTFGDGLFFTIGVLYFTRIVGLPVGQVGIGLTIAGGFGVAAGIIFGKLADRWPARRLMTWLLVLQAAAMAGYVMIRSFWVFLALACLAAFIDRGCGAVRAAVIATSVTGPDRVAGKAFLRSVTNVGIGAGCGVAAIALQASSRTAYIALIFVDVATFAAGALLMAGLPELHPAVPSSEAGPTGASSPWRDRLYLSFVALNSVLSLQFAILEIGVPLWIVRSTSAPRVLVAVLFVINTTLVVLLQVRASRGLEDLQRAASRFRLAGLLFAAGCLLFGCADGLPTLPAAAVLVLAAVVQTLGEVLSSAAGWTLSYDLADPAALGAYLGVVGAGTSAATMLGPAIITWTAIRFGFAGWAALAALFALTGAAMVPVMRWNRRATVYEHVADNPGRG